jgi:anti-anti-sigma factor
MTNCTITRQAGITRLTISGRIDSMSSPDIHQQLDELILGGNRRIVTDLEQVHFVSSAGLRVFLLAQNQLRTVGGEILFFKTPETVMKVFTMTGFDKLFKLVASEQELSAVFAAAADAAEVTSTVVDGITFKYSEDTSSATGALRIIGSQEKLPTSEYIEKDVNTVSQAELTFATGLATLGERYEEYKNLFGEALIINKHFYFYPAVKRPAVDYMFYSGQDSGSECRFLHGFGFNGPYRYLASFETLAEFITLDRLVQWVLTLPLASPLLGLVLLAESKGLLGMNLKQIPLLENKPAQGGDVFAVEHVASWINFPVDPTDHNHIIAATGLVGRDRGACSAAVQKLFSKESSTHIHAGVFAKGPISKNINQFSDELNRVLTELDISKVQHLMGQSRFSNGMLGIVELKG